MGPLKQLIVYSVMFICISATTHIDRKFLKCLVCQATIEELDIAVSKLDPKKLVDVGSYRLDATGDLKKKTVPQSQSEIKLSEMIDEICNKMDDYVRATWKHNGQLMLLKLVGADGKMNNDFSKVDIIQDDDLNKSLKYYCEGIVEEHEDKIIEYFKNKIDNIDIRLCSHEAKLCNHELPDEDRIVDEL